MLGFYSFPSFMYDSNISEVNKVLMFNRFVRKIEKVEAPDIIIIGIPGGIMPYNRQFTRAFEEQISSHISIDSKSISEKNKTYSQCKNTVLNILNEDDAEKMANIAIEKLNEYSNVEIV